MKVNSPPNTIVVNGGKSPSLSLMHIADKRGLS